MKLHKVLSISLAFMVVGIAVLLSLGEPSQERVFADVSARAPQSPQTLFLPFITNHYSLTIAPLWRFGVGQARQPLSTYSRIDIAALRLGWYSDWTVSTNVTELDAMQQLGIEYVPTVRLKQWKKYDDLHWTTWCYTCAYATPYTYSVSPDRSIIQSVALTRPGMTWIIGNEIERIDWDNGRQDEILPEVYAVAYNEIYTLIKSADPTAQVAIGGVVQSTPLRLQYLDRVWLAYQSAFSTTMPVDVWNAHAFVLQEVAGSWGADIPAGITSTTGIVYSMADNKNFSKAWSNIIAMRSWMNGKGERSKPLWITEYGVNFPPDYPGFSYPEVRDSFMLPSFSNFLTQTSVTVGFPTDANRLVQRWNWYSLDDDSGYWSDGTYYQNFNGNLFYSGLGSASKGVSALGMYWQAYVTSLSNGASKPYAPMVASPVSSRVIARPAAVVVPSECASSQRVQLNYYQPTAQQNIKTQATPKLLRQEWVCGPQ